MDSKQLFWCRIYLLATVVLIASAYVNGFRFLRSAVENDYRIVSILTILAGLFIARGIKEYAKNLFDTGNNKLWFASFSAFVFVSFVLFLTTTMFLLLSTTIINPMELKALRPEQMMFLLPASTIIWLLCMASGRPQGVSWLFRFRLPKLFSFSKLKECFPSKKKLKKTKKHDLREDMFI